MRLKNPINTTNYPRFNQILIGTINGLNRTFTTPHKFTYDPVDGFEPVFKRNGQTVYLNIEIRNISESGGVGTGYDTIEFVKPPKRNDVLTADYVVMD